MKKAIIIISLIIITAVVVIEGAVWLSPDKTPVMGNRMNFLIATESNDDAVIEIYINDFKMSQQELEGVSVGYFGQEFTYTDLGTPESNFTLRAVETKSGIEEIIEINPSDGNYIDITFWTDHFQITQSKEQQIRID